MKTFGWRHNVRTSLALCVWALLWANYVHALRPNHRTSQYVHDNWTHKDGLPEGAVYSIFQCRKGYLWLGTKGNLVRFDGLDFEKYEPGDNGLSQYSFVRQIVELKDGKILAGVIGGVLQYHEAKFTQFTDRHGLNHPFVYALALGHDDQVWVGTGGAGVWRLDAGEYIQHPAYEKGNLPGQVKSLFTNKDGLLWVGTDQGLLILEEKQKIKHVLKDLPSAVVNVMIGTGVDDSVFVGTRIGLVRLARDGRLLQQISPIGVDENVTAITVDGNGQLWYGTYDGWIHRVEFRGNESIFVDSVKTSGSVYALLEDRLGSMWVGTEEGLERYADALFTTYGQKEGLPEEQILNLAPHNQGGVIVLDADGALYHLDDSKTNIVQMIAPTGTIQGEGVLGVAQTSDGSIYVGGAVLRRFKSGSIEEFSQPGGEFAVVVPDGNGLLLGQTEPDGRSVISRFQNGQFAPIFIDASLNHVQRIFKDSLGNIWISTGGTGVVKFGAKGIETMTTKDGLPHDIAYTFVEGSAGHIWVSTRSAIARIDDKKGINAVPGKQGVQLHSAPLHLVLDEFENLWVSTDDGVFRRSLSALENDIDKNIAPAKLRRFSLSSGIRGRDISWRPGGIAKTKDGRIWLATNRGISVVNPKQVVPLSVPEYIQIDEVFIDGKQASYTKKGVVTEGRKQIVFHYSAPVLQNPKELLFQYRLVGYDEGWVNVANRKRAYYTNVSPGEYQFQVRVQRPGTAAVVFAAPLSFRIIPKWYETNYAQFFAGALFVFLIFGGYRLRVRQLKAREGHLKKLVHARTTQLQHLNEQLEQRVSDRTAQLQVANKALADEKERLAVTLRSLHEGVITIDCDKRVRLLNDVAQRLLQLSSKKALGQSIEELLVLHDRFKKTSIPLPFKKILSSNNKGVEVIAQAVLAQQNGEDCLVDISVSAIQDHNAIIVGAVLVLADVTEKTKVEEKLQKSQKLEAIGILAGGIAHDFNNLITGVVGYMDLALRTIDKDHMARKWLSNSVEIADNARALTQQLLTFASGGSPATASHSLQSLVEQSIRFVLSGSKVSVDLNVADDLWPCDVDAQQIRQVFDNLILNARQAMTEGGRLKVSLSNQINSEDALNELAAGKYVVVELTDTGGGIPLDIQNRIFDPFFTTKENGNGLGLATVHSIVQKHGGNIDLNSIIGEGTTFDIWLRAADSAPVQSAVIIPPRDAPSGRNKILVMDDDPNIRRITKMALENYGYCVSVASDGTEAEELFLASRNDAEPFVLAIVDLTIPGGRGGVDTLQSLKELDATLPVIASSGYSKEEVLSKESTYRFDGLLPKPYTVNMLIHEVSKYIHR